MPGYPRFAGIDSLLRGIDEISAGLGRSKKNAQNEFCATGIAPERRVC